MSNVTIHDDPEKVLVAIRTHMEDKEIDFNFDFVNSLEKFYEENGTLTDNQMKALVNICQGYKVQI